MRTPSSRCWLVLLALIAAPTHAAAAEPALVGDLARLDRIAVTGATTFTAAAVVAAVRSDTTIALAAHPRAPRAALLATVGARLLLAYRYAGFARADVAVREDQGGLAIGVTEGPRLRQGAVRVRGNQQLATADIVRDLTATPAGQRAWWVPGEPAHCDPPSATALHDHLLYLYRGAGRFDARCAVAVEATEDGQADLVVDVQDEGPPAQLAAIEVTGLARVPRATLDGVLAVAVGQALDERTLPGVRERLTASGRFCWHAERLAPTARPGAYALAVDLAEPLALPLLGEPLDAVDEALLRARTWLLDRLLSGRSELVVEATPRDGTWSATVVIGRSGLALTVQGHPPGAPTSTLTLWLRDGDAGLAAVEARCGLRFGAGFHFCAQGSLTGIKPAAQPSHDQTTLAFQAGYFGQASATPLLLVIDPAAALALGHQPGAVRSVADGVLSIAAPRGDARLTTQAGSGEFDALRAELGDGDRRCTLLVRVQEGRLAADVAALTRDGSGIAWTGIGQTPWTTALDLVLRQARAWLPVVAAVRGFDATQSAQFCARWRPFLVEGLVRPLEAAVVARGAGAPAGEPLFLPDAPPSGIAHLLSPGSQDLPPGFLAKIVSWLACAGDRLLPEAVPTESWPRVLLRSSIQLAANQTTYLEDDWLRLSTAPTQGPLGALATAQALAPVAAPWARMQAKSGLDRLDEAGLDRDLALLAPQAGWLVPTIAAWSPWLGGLRDDERQELVEAVAQVRAGRAAGRSDDQILRDTAHRAWSAGLAARVAAGLRSFLPAEGQRFPLPW